MRPPDFVGVAWGWPTAKGRQRVHLVHGPCDVEVASYCGAAVRVWPHGPGLDSHPAVGLDQHGRPMLTCGNCRRIAGARLAGLRQTAICHHCRDGGTCAEHGCHPLPGAQVVAESRRVDAPPPCDPRRGVHSFAPEARGADRCECGAVRWRS